MCEQWLSLLLDTTVPLGVNFTKAVLLVFVTFRGLALHRKKTVKNCLNARAKMTSDKFDDERDRAQKRLNMRSKTQALFPPFDFQNG